MRFLVEVRVDLTKMPEFGMKLQKGELNRSLICSETYCLHDDPAVGYSYWQAESRAEFDLVFSEWKPFYSVCKVSEVVSAQEAMILLRGKF